MAAATTIERISKVARWGNSLGVRIPREAAEQLKLRNGETVKVQVKNGVMTIRKAKQRKRWTEAELLKGITPDVCGPDLIPDRMGRELI
jgi:antitoxin MazE